MSAPVLKAEAVRKLIRHEDDLHAWSLEQAECLKQSRFGDLDLEHLADEIADVGGQQYDKLESALRLIFLHMLKWDYQPSFRSRSWVNTINEQRRQVQRVLRKSPSLKSAFDEAVTEAYESARSEASSETDIDIKIFPAVSPYTRDEFMGRPFAWPVVD